MNVSTVNNLLLDTKKTNIISLLSQVKKYTTTVEGSEESLSAFTNLIKFLSELADFDTIEDFAVFLNKNTPNKTTNAISKENLNKIAPEIKCVLDKYFKSAKTRQDKLKDVNKQIMENKLKSCPELSWELSEIKKDDGRLYEIKTQKFAKLFKEKGVNNSDIARIIGVHRGKIPRKIMSPPNITSWKDYEIKLIGDFLNLSPSELFYYFFTDEIAEENIQKEEINNLAAENIPTEE